MVELSSPIELAPGVGPKLARELHALGVWQIKDLCALSTAQLRTRPSVGDRSIENLERLAQAYGLVLGSRAAAAHYGSPAPDVAVKLTPREIEVLQWTFRGKTAWEAATILGISERTANLHLQNSMRKLGQRTKHLAALRAMDLGMISA